MQHSISARFSFRFSSNLAHFSWRNNFQELINAAELTNNVEVSTRDRHSICCEHYTTVPVTTHRMSCCSTLPRWTNCRLFPRLQFVGNYFRHNGWNCVPYHSARKGTERSSLAETNGQHQQSAVCTYRVVKSLCALDRTRRASPRLPRLDSPRLPRLDSPRLTDSLD
jgi:hypothetical protein